MSQVRSNDANNANVNRIVRFDITAGGGATPAADMFAALEGPNYHYKHYGKVQNPTAAQQLAQLRLSLITRSLSRYAILVGVQVADEGAGAGSAVRLEFETDRSGVFYNNGWSSNQALDKDIVTDIVDTVGIGGMSAGPKTKAGLQSMLDELDAVSYDDGVTFIFGTDSTTGVTMPDGTTATGPSLAGGANSGLVVVWDNPAVI